MHTFVSWPKGLLVNEEYDCIMPHFVALDRGIKDVLWNLLILDILIEA